MIGSNVGRGHDPATIVAVMTVPERHLHQGLEAQPRGVGTALRGFFLTKLPNGALGGRQGRVMLVIIVQIIKEIIIASSRKKKK